VFKPEQCHLGGVCTHVTVFDKSFWNAIVSHIGSLDDDDPSFLRVARLEFISQGSLDPWDHGFPINCLRFRVWFLLGGRAKDKRINEQLYDDESP